MIVAGLVDRVDELRNVIPGHQVGCGQRGGSPGSKLPHGGNSRTIKIGLQRVLDTSCRSFHDGLIVEDFAFACK